MQMEILQKTKELPLNSTRLVIFRNWHPGNVPTRSKMFLQTPSYLKEQSQPYLLLTQIKAQKNTTFMMKLNLTVR